MRLRPYIPEKDFEAVQTWVNDERVHAMWCANLIQYPLEKNNFEEVLQKGKERLGEIPLIAETEDKKAAGLICYSLNQETQMGMLRFVILDRRFGERDMAEKWFPWQHSTVLKKQEQRL